MKRLIALVAVVALLAGAGCKATLEQGGAYAPVDGSGAALIQPDYGFFIVDSAFDLAYSSIDAAFTFEYSNRVMLWRISPDIKHGLDSIRPQAVEIRNEYIKARAAYMANPVPAGLDQLQALLAKVQQLASTATALLPKGN